MRLLLTELVLLMTVSACHGDGPESATDGAVAVDSSSRADASEPSADLSAEVDQAVTDDLSVAEDLSIASDLTAPPDLLAPPDLALPCPYSGPDVISPSTLTSCASASCINAHCWSADEMPPDERASFAACAGGGFCVPDALIRTADHFVPPPCTSIAGVEGRCVSTCLPWVAARVSILPPGGCSVGELCAPCYDPLDDGADTGLCRLACDMPAQAPVQLICPWPTGSPAVIAPASLPACGCSGAHCVPTVGLPMSDPSLFNGCSGGYCAPDEIIRAGGAYKPDGCAPFSGVTTNSDGRCLSSCMPLVAAQPSAEQASCAAGHKCVPCADPYTGANTGACELSSCDMPPAVAFTFPGCCSNAGVAGGRCLPKSQIADAQESRYTSTGCTDPGSLCVPNEELPSPYNTATVGCHVDSGVVPPFTYDGTCVSKCINDPTIAFLPKSTCPANHVCAPPP